MNIDQSPDAGKLNPTLSHKHIADLAKSGITADVAAKCGLSTVDSRVASRELGWSRATNKLGQCLRIPYHNLNGKPTGYVQVKPDSPRTSKPKHGQSEEKFIKYESPKGSENHLYFPPICIEQLRNNSQPIVLTEGAKKAISLSVNGFTACAVTGVWNWVRGGRATDTTGRKIGKPKLIDDFDALNLSRRIVYVLFDSDAATKGAVQAAEKHLCSTLREAGAIPVVVRLPSPPDGAKCGADDFLMANGAEALRSLIAEAEATLCSASRGDPLEPGGELPAHPNANAVCITITTAQFQTNGDARKSLAHDLDLYVRGGVLVQVEPPSRDYDAKLVAVPKAIVQEKLTRHCRFQKYKRVGQNTQLVPADPPEWCVNAVYATTNWPNLRNVRTLVTHPVMMPEGSILAENGFHAETGTLVQIPDSLKVNVSNNPTTGDVNEAVGLLLDVVCDYQFVDDCDRSAWLAGVFTLLARHLYNGSSPLFLFDANCRGTGKTLLADTASLIVYGRRFKTQSYHHDANEMSKTITSLALEGRASVLLDNVRDRFGNVPLEIATTSTTWDGRILGESKNYSGPLSVAWFATANNAQIVGDMGRRIMSIRITTDAEKPEEQGDFKYPDLRKHCLENRSALLSACLTILRAWHVAGRPKANLPEWGSYVEWSDVVRQAILFAGLPDPYGSRSGISDGSDRDETNMRAILACWAELDPTGEGVTAAQALDKLKRAESGLDGPTPDWAVTLRDSLEEILDSRVNASKLGCCLRSYKGRNFGGVRLEVGEDRHRKVNRWYVRTVSAAKKPNSAGDGSHPPRIEIRRKHMQNSDLQKLPDKPAGDAGDVSASPTPAKSRRFGSDPDRGVSGVTTKGGGS